jgi:hypothetical protein
MLGLFIYTHFIKNRIARGLVMAEPQANGNPQAGEPGANAQQPQAGNPPNAPQAGDSNQNQQEPKLTKEEFDRLSKKAHEANNEAKNLRERLRALESEKEKAEAEQLAKQGEFKTLYEQEQAKVKGLEPVVEENTFLRDYAMKQLEATIKDWPDEVKAFDPGKKAALQARLTGWKRVSPWWRNSRTSNSSRGKPGCLEARYQPISRGQRPLTIITKK